MKSTANNGGFTFETVCYSPSDFLWVSLFHYGDSFMTKIKFYTYENGSTTLLGVICTLGCVDSIAIDEDNG